MFAKIFKKQRMRESLVVQVCLLATFTTVALIKPHLKPYEIGMTYDLAKAHQLMEHAHNLMNPVNATDIPQNEKSHRAATMQAEAMRELIFAVSAAEQRAQRTEKKTKELVLFALVAGLFGLTGFTIIRRMRRNAGAQQDIRQ
jgi:hypothetical protein